MALDPGSLPEARPAAAAHVLVRDKRVVQGSARNAPFCGQAAAGPLLGQARMAFWDADHYNSATLPFDLVQVPVG